MQTASAPFDPDSKIKCLVRSPHCNDRTTNHREIKAPGGSAAIFSLTQRPGEMRVTGVPELGKVRQYFDRRYLFGCWAARPGVAGVTLIMRQLKPSGDARSGHRSSIWGRR